MKAPSPFPGTLSFVRRLGRNKGQPYDGPVTAGTTFVEEPMKNY